MLKVGAEEQSGICRGDGEMFTCCNHHMKSYLWLDFQQLNGIYFHKTEEYSYIAMNKFSVILIQIQIEFYIWYLLSGFIFRYVKFCLGRHPGLTQLDQCFPLCL